MSCQAPQTTPKAMFGDDFGDDYWLASYTQLIARSADGQYWHRVAQESDRIRLERIGTTSEGRFTSVATRWIHSHPKHYAGLAAGRYVMKNEILYDGDTLDTRWPTDIATPKK